VRFVCADCWLNGFDGGWYDGHKVKGWRKIFTRASHLKIEREVVDEEDSDSVCQGV
jgi:hypothetical protein